MLGDERRSMVLPEGSLITDVRDLSRLQGQSGVSTAFEALLRRCRRQQQPNTVESKCRQNADGLRSKAEREGLAFMLHLREECRRSDAAEGLERLCERLRAAGEHFPSSAILSILTALARPYGANDEGPRLGPVTTALAKRRLGLSQGSSQAVGADSSDDEQQPLPCLAHNYEAFLHDLSTQGSADGALDVAGLEPSEQSRSTALVCDLDMGHGRTMPRNLGPLRLLQSVLSDEVAVDPADALLGVRYTAMADPPQQTPGGSITTVEPASTSRQTGHALRTLFEHMCGPRRCVGWDVALYHDHEGPEVTSLALVSQDGAGALEVATRMAHHGGLVEETELQGHVLNALMGLPSESFELQSDRAALVPVGNLRTWGRSASSTQRLLAMFAQAGTCLLRLEAVGGEAWYSGEGQVVTAFGSALTDEVMTIEAEIEQHRQCFSAHGDADNKGSLIRIFGATRALRQRVVYLASLCGCTPLHDKDRVRPWSARDAVRNLPRGAALLDRLYRAACMAEARPTLHTACHSTTSVRGVAIALLERAAAPYCHLLAKWIYQGDVRDIDDPYHEFPLRALDGRPPSDPSGSTFLTRGFDEPSPDHDYGFPPFIKHGLKSRVVMAGKLLHLLRQCSSVFYNGCAAKVVPRLSLVLDDTSLQEVSAAGPDHHAWSLMEDCVRRRKEEDVITAEEQRRKRALALEEERRVVGEIERKMRLRIEAAGAREWEYRRALVAQAREAEARRQREKIEEEAVDAEIASQLAKEQKEKLEEDKRQMVEKYSDMLAQAERRVVWNMWRRDRMERMRTTRQRLGHMRRHESLQWQSEMGRPKAKAELDVTHCQTPREVLVSPEQASVSPSSPSQQPHAAHVSTFSGKRIMEEPGGSSARVAALLTMGSAVQRRVLTAHAQEGGGEDEVGDAQTKGKDESPRTNGTAQGGRQDEISVSTWEAAHQGTKATPCVDHVSLSPSLSQAEPCSITRVARESGDTHEFAATGPALSAHSIDATGAEAPSLSTQAADVRHEDKSFSGVRVMQEPGGSSQQVSALLGGHVHAAALHPASATHSTANDAAAIAEPDAGQSSFSGIRVTREPGDSSRGVARLLGGGAIEPQAPPPLLNGEFGHHTHSDVESSQEASELAETYVPRLPGRVSDPSFAEDDDTHRDNMGLEAVTSERWTSQPSSQVPLDILRSRGLDRVLIHQCARVERVAVSFFLHEARVRRHVLALRRYMLGTRSTLLREFVALLHESMRTSGYRRDWPRASDVQYCRISAVTAAGLESDPHRNRFSYKVVKGPSSTPTKGELGQLDALHPRYETPWQLGVVLTRETTEAYAATHRFLLRLYWLQHVVQTTREALRLACNSAASETHSAGIINDGDPQVAMVQRTAHVLVHRLSSVVLALLEHATAQTEGHWWTQLEEILSATPGPASVSTLEALNSAYAIGVAERCFVLPPSKGEDEDEVGVEVAGLLSQMCEASSMLDTAVRAGWKGIGLRVMGVKQELDDRLRRLQSCLQRRRRHEHWLPSGASPPHFLALLLLRVQELQSC